MLNLVPTRKLIKDIKRLSPDSFLVGFKLASKVNQKELLKITDLLFLEAGCDVVVANSLNNGYKAYVVNADGEILAEANDKKRLAKNLVDLIK